MPAVDESQFYKPPAAGEPNSAERGAPAGFARIAPWILLALGAFFLVPLVLTCALRVLEYRDQIGIFDPSLGGDPVVFQHVMKERAATALGLVLAAVAVGWIAVHVVRTRRLPVVASTALVVFGGILVVAMTSIWRIEGLSAPACGSPSQDGSQCLAPLYVAFRTEVLGAGVIGVLACTTGVGAILSRRRRH